MKVGIMKTHGFAVLSILCLCLVPAVAQVKPAESTSKVKKVLLYNKVGGYVPDDGIAAVKETLSKLGAAKGFELVQVDSDSALTLDYLNGFQAIVWNNNTDGGLSVPGTRARQAVLDYLDQGGGWMLVCFAGDHRNTWPGLAERVGTTSWTIGATGRGEVVLDGAARAHGELQWMVQGFPETIELHDIWFSFRNTVRPLPGVTVVATARGIPGIPNVVDPVRDGSGDNVYIWAREVGRGRLLYNAIGFGRFNLMGQQDSVVPKLYWENIRYLAGDFRNGCTDPASPGFDPAARVHVESMCSPVALTSAPSRASLVVSKGALRMRLAIPEGPLHVRLRDLRGALVQAWALPAGSGELALDGALASGVHHIELRGSAGAVQRRLLLP